MVVAFCVSRAARQARGAGAVLLAILISLVVGAWTIRARAQADDAAQRAQRRIQALQREADDLATRARTLLGELRAVEIERELQTERAREAGRQLAEVERELVSISDRIKTLDSSAAVQRPELAARLVELYKLRNGGYVRLVLNVADAQRLGRAYRFAAAMQQMDARRVEDYRRTVAELRRSETALREKQTHLSGLKADAAAAAAAASAAVAARGALMDRIDARRDLNARLVGELQVARDRLQAEVEGLHAAPPAGAPPEVLPLEPFRGELDWPVDGRLLSGFGRSRDPRARASVLNNGLQIGAPAGAEVRAIHDGTVSYAAPFSGFGNLVIVDHGALAYSLYGQLADILVEKGQHLPKGAVVGTIGASLDGQAALYFELRIDAQAVDPLQWLKKR